MTDGLHSEASPIDELIVEKLDFHPAIVKELDRLRGNNLNLLRKSQPTDVPNIALAQASLNMIEILLAMPERLVAESKAKPKEREHPARDHRQPRVEKYVK